MNTSTLGTALPVRTHSDLTKIYVVGMGDAPKQRTDAKTNLPKVNPNGEMTYSSGTILRVLTKDGSIRNDKTASIHVTEPASVYELGQVYEAVGDIFVQPYESNGRVALSITVQALVLASATAAGNRPSTSAPADKPASTKAA
jgi:hypothetical protein